LVSSPTPPSAAGIGPVKVGEPMAGAETSFEANIVLRRFVEEAVKSIPDPIRVNVYGQTTPEQTKQLESAASSVSRRLCELAHAFQQAGNAEVFEPQSSDNAADEYARMILKLAVLAWPASRRYMGLGAQVTTEGSEAWKTLRERLKALLRGDSESLASIRCGISKICESALEEQKQGKGTGGTMKDSILQERKRIIPDDEANIKVGDYLKEHPAATAREIREKVGIALGRVSKMPAWRAEQGRRKAAKGPKKRETRRLTKKMAKVIERGDDPAMIAEAKEITWQTLIEKAKPEERAKLHAMSSEERESLIDTATGSLADEATESEEEDDDS
jgi:hypothetical protein